MPPPLNSPLHLPSLARPHVHDHLVSFPLCLHHSCTTYHLPYPYPFEQPTPLLTPFFHVYLSINHGELRQIGHMLAKVVKKIDDVICYSKLFI